MATDKRLVSLENTFKALADQTRLRILGLLQAGEICVCDIHGSLGLPQPTVSRHLAYLRKSGLVATRKEGSGCTTGSRSCPIRSCRPSSMP